MSLDGVMLTVMVLSPLLDALADDIVGVEGLPTGVIIDAALAAPLPASFTPLILTLYVVPFVKPVI